MSRDDDPDLAFNRIMFWCPIAGVTILVLMLWANERHRNMTRFDDGAIAHHEGRVVVSGERGNYTVRKFGVCPACGREVGR